MTHASSSHRSPPFWRGDPLIVASKSSGRARLLHNAGVPFIAVDSGLDERSIEKSLTLTPPELALRLALEKSKAASRSHANRIVLGADQVMALEETVLHKATSREGAIAQLKQMRGRRHRLHSAVALVRDGEALFSHVSSATIAMRDFSDDTLGDYADAMGDRLLQTVGAYEIEGIGINLMESMDGDYFTIVGLPLLPLLAYCRSAGLMSDEGRRT
jgi:septum formation protein